MNNAPATNGARHRTPRPGSRFLSLFAVVVIGTTLSGRSAPAQVVTTEDRAMKHSPTVAVAPADEITIIDPGASPEGKPTPSIYKGRDGQPRVDIPPAVIVHNYYYTGDRDFRGPIFPGGPSIVVVSHPDTGERLYLDVQLLPGSPRVVYRRHHIEYRFQRQRIRICFRDPKTLGLCREPTISYHTIPKSVDTLKKAAKDEAAHIKDVVRRLGVPTVLKKAHSGVRSTFKTTAVRIHDAGELVLTPVKRVVRSTPLGSILKESPEDLAARARDADVAETADARRRAEASIRTLR